MRVLIIVLFPVFLATCGGSDDSGAAFKESCIESGDCAEGLACMGGICLRRDGCDTNGCDWENEVCITDQEGVSSCVPSCVDKPTACEDLSPSMMNSHPVVGYWQFPDSNEVTPAPVCACLEYRCTQCAANELCFAGPNSESPEMQFLHKALFPSEFLATDGECVPRP